MSLEDIYPMAMAFIIILVFLAYIFGAVARNLGQKDAEANYRTAVELSEIITTKSVLVYENKPGLLDSDKLDIYAYLYESLYLMYGVPGYGFSIEVKDLADESRVWSIGPREDDSIILSTPVGIRYRVDEVHEGLLSLSVWRT